MIAFIVGTLRTSLTLVIDLVGTHTNVWPHVPPRVWSCHGVYALYSNATRAALVGGRPLDLWSCGDKRWCPQTRQAHPDACGRAAFDDANEIVTADEATMGVMSRRWWPSTVPHTPGVRNDLLGHQFTNCKWQLLYCVCLNDCMYSQLIDDMI